MAQARSGISDGGDSGVLVPPGLRELVILRRIRSGVDEIGFCGVLPAVSWFGQNRVENVIAWIGYTISV